MSNEKIKVTIDRLNIRLKRISAGSAQAVVADLGNRLLEQLARQETGIKGNPRTSLDHVDAGTLTLQKGENIRDRIVSGIVKKVESGFTGTAGESKEKR